ARCRLRPCAPGPGDRVPGATACRRRAVGWGRHTAERRSRSRAQPAPGAARRRQVPVFARENRPSYMTVLRIDGLEQFVITEAPSGWSAPRSQVPCQAAGGGPRWTRTTYLRVISTALCQLS